MDVPGRKCWRKILDKIADKVCQYMNRGYAVEKCGMLLRNVDLFFVIF